MGAVFFKHISECPPGAFIYCCVLVILPSVRHTVTWYKLDIYLDFLAWILRPLVRLVLTLLLSPFRLILKQFSHGPRKAAEASCISALPRSLICQNMILPFIFLGLPFYEPDLCFCLLSWTVLWPAAPISQASRRSVPSVSPFVHSLSRYMISICRICYAMTLLLMFQYPLTKCGFLCILSHERTSWLCVGLVALHYTTWFSFCYLLCVTYVLYSYSFARTEDTCCRITIHIGQVSIAQTMSQYHLKLKSLNCLDEMIDVARKLSKGIPFVRVDLYCVNNQILFSEMTFFPGGGYGFCSPAEWEIRLEEWITLLKRT